ERSLGRPHLSADEPGSRLPAYLGRACCLRPGAWPTPTGHAGRPSLGDWWRGLAVAMRHLLPAHHPKPRSTPGTPGTPRTPGTPGTEPDGERSGVDLGIVTLATDSEGEHFTGARIHLIRDRYHLRRHRLQKCGTRNAKRRIRRMGRREARFQRDTN